MLTCLLTATVGLFGPWNSRQSPAITLASYQLPPASPLGSPPFPAPMPRVNASAVKQPVGFYEVDFDVVVASPKTGFPAGTELHVIGVYEGALPNGQTEKPWWANCPPEKDNRQLMLECHRKFAGQHTEKTIAVSVSRSSAPVVLALMAYEPVKWKILPTAGTNIQKIILSGYHGQDIDGSLGNVPVEVYSHQSSPCQNCSRQAGYFFAYKQGSAEYTQAIDKLKMFTGLSPSSFQGAYRSDRFSIGSETLSSSVSAPGAMDGITGKDFVDRIKISNTVVPLPEGQWRGIVFVKNPTNRGSDELAVLARIEKNQVLELIAVRAQLATDGKGFSRHSSCDRTDSFASKVETNESFGLQLCYWVNHVTEPWVQPIFSVAAARLVSLGVTTPDILINTGFHKADKISSLTVLYLTNPSSKGIATPLTNWDASPWHPSNILRFPENNAYVKNQIRWGESWFQIYRATKS